MLLLPFRQRERHLGAAVPEIELERHQRKAPLLDRTDQFFDLAAVEEELAGTYRIVIVAVPLLVRRDVHGLEEDLAVVHPAEGLLDRCFPGAERLDLGA